MEWNTTSTVLARLHASQGNSAWDLLVGHFRDTLVRFSERMGLPRPEAQDAAQETLMAFLEGYRAGRYDRTKGRLKSWLFGIAHRQTQALRRRRAQDRVTHASDAELPMDLVEGEEQAASAWEEEWQRTLFTRALERVRAEVSPGTFDIFRALVFDEMDTDAVCERFQIERTKVYNVKHRVTRRLNQLVQEFDDA